MLTQQIRSRREAMGLTLKELQARTGIAAPNLSRLERGQVDARLSTVSRVLEALGLELTVQPRRRLTLAEVKQRMAEGRERLRLGGITDRDVEERLAWKESRGMDTSVERWLLEQR